MRVSLPRRKAVLELRMTFARYPTETAPDECEATPERCACGARLTYDEQVSDAPMCAECAEDNL